jgi:hypothetical protein
MVDKVALGQVFSEYLTSPYSSSSINWDWYNRPNSADVSSELGLSPPICTFADNISV